MDAKKNLHFYSQISSNLMKKKKEYLHFCTVPVPSSFAVAAVVAIVDVDGDCFVSILCSCVIFGIVEWIFFSKFFFSF